MESTKLVLEFPLRGEDRQNFRWDCFWLAESFTTQLSTGEWITVPVGYVTDGASVPLLLQFIFPAIGDHLGADILHDYLYTTNLVSRTQADKEFLIAMTKARPYKKSWLDNHLRYWAVKLFGRSHYTKPLIIN